MSLYSRFLADRSVRLRSVVWVLLSALAALTATTFLIRLYSVIKVGALFTSTGAEEDAIYGVWRVHHGYPAYEYPLSGYYPLDLYNWLFYYTYAAIMRLLHVSDSALLLTGRMLTLCFTGLGLAGFLGLVREFTQHRKLGGSVMILAGLVWLDCGVAGWLQISIRPDMAALSMATWALLAFFWAARARTSGWFVVASLLFYLGWAFKQTTIFIFGSCCLLLLINRSVRGLISLLLPFAVLCAASFVVGGQNYYLNTIYAPGINPFVLTHGLSEILSAAPSSIFILFGGILAWAAIVRDLLKKESTSLAGVGGPQLLLLITAFCCAGAANAASICRLGSSRNTLLEAFLVSGLLTALLLVETWDLKISGFSATCLILVLALNVIASGSKLVFFNRIGRMTLADDAAYFEKGNLAALVRSLPPPVLVRDGILSMPWYATGDRYPVVLDDSLFYQAAMERGDLKEYPIKTLLEHRHFHSALLKRDDYEFGWAISNGCRESPNVAAASQSLILLDCER